MGNLCSIFHLRFKNLIKIIPSVRKAQLVDYILLGWQTSTFKLKGSDNKWFMKPYSQIVEDTGIPKSTLERYIKELSDEGFIERRQALYSRTNGEGAFEVKKGTYIYITEKLLTLINVNSSTPNSNKSFKQSDELENIKHQTQLATSSSIKECSTIDNNEGFDSLKIRGSNIRDLYSSLKNNIIIEKETSTVNKTNRTFNSNQFDSIQQLLFSDIKEEIPFEVKNLVSGTFFNLTFKQNKKFSTPKQLVAEYLFALLNVEFYLPHVHCFKHRNNILAKMIRSNLWKTPKGFYKHFYLGQSFKDQIELREKKWRLSKEMESNPIATDERLTHLEERMYKKSILIDELQKQLYQLSDENELIATRDKIQKLRQELEFLWKQQYLIEEELKLAG
jgi:DNA-binding Lrp family transcriptional regulator